MSEFRPSRFEMLPLIIKNIIIINVLVWLAQFFFDRQGNGFITNFFALHDVHSTLFKPHQILTHLFMHDPASPWHLFSNMFGLWMFGSTLENFWGPKRFLIFYLICGIGAALIHLGALYYQTNQIAQILAEFKAMPSQDYILILQHKYGLELTPEQINIIQLFLQNKANATLAADSYTILQNNLFDGATLGASGAVFGVLIAFAYYWPNSQLFIIPIPFPIKAKYFIGGYILLELYLGIQNSTGDNVAHFAHLGGALVGFLLVKFWNVRNRKDFY